MYFPRPNMVRGRRGSWIYNYLCNQCLSPLMLWVQIPFRARCTALCDKVCQWHATCRWFSPGTPVSSINKTDHSDITETLLKVALNTIIIYKPCKIDVNNANDKIFITIKIAITDIQVLVSELIQYLTSEWKEIK